ncbi:MAG: hypothetical protein JJ896_06790 [Rhodothermales bacterium]|nr:hypothetical protein [Rhodothermales bacterium]MBO6779343.1 hypothetical protein [Rhodothermales bacterium]
MTAPAPVRARFTALLLGWIDAFLPRGVVQPDVRLRMRLVVVCSFGLALFAAFFGLVAATQQGAFGPIAVLLLGGAFAATALPLVLRRTGSRVLAGTLLCAEFALLVGIVAYLGNGFDAAVLIWIPAVPLLAAFLVGPRAAVALASVTVAEVALLYVLKQAGLQAEPSFSSEQVEATRFLALISGCILAAFLGWLYESQSLVTLRRAAQRTRILHTIGRSVLSASTAEEIAVAALVRLGILVQSTRSAILEYDDEGNYARVLAVRLHGEAEMGSGRRIPRDVLGHPRKPAGDAVIYGLAEGAEPIPSRLRVPLEVDGANLGLLDLGAPTARAFDADAEAIAHEVADMLALALRQRRYERELVRAKERAEKSEQLQNALLTNMSHEVRTPLAGIMGIASVLQEEVGGDLREMANMIEISGERLFNTLDSVIDLAQIESDVLTFEAVPFDVVACAREVASVFERAATAKGLVFSVDADEDEVPVFADEGWTRRVLHCLVDNAVKFTESGSIRLIVSATRQATMIRVHDTGIGISPGFQPAAFDAFQQESSGMDRTHEGSGLGLALADRLTNLMGGTLTVESSQGIGSTFTLLLPRPPKQPAPTGRHRSGFGTRR